MTKFSELTILSSDIDGCLAQVDKAMVERYAKVFGLSQARAYDELFVRTDYDHRHPFIKEYCYNDPTFWENLEPYENNRISLLRFRTQNEGVDTPRLYFNTARPSELRAVTEIWLEKQLGLLGFDGLLMDMKDKKQEGAEMVGATAHIDDRYREAKTFVGTGISVIMIKKIYNVKDRNKDDAKTFTWVEALKDLGEPF